MPSLCFPPLGQCQTKGEHFALILAQLREVAGPSWTPAPRSGLLGPGDSEHEGAWWGQAEGSEGTGAQLGGAAECERGWLHSVSLPGQK